MHKTVGKGKCFARSLLPIESISEMLPRKSNILMDFCIISFTAYPETAVSCTFLFIVGGFI